MKGNLNGLSIKKLRSILDLLDSWFELCERGEVNFRTAFRQQFV